MKKIIGVIVVANEVTDQGTGSKKKRSAGVDGSGFVTERSRVYMYAHGA